MQRFLTWGPRYSYPGSAAALIRRNSYSKIIGKGSAVFKNFSLGVRNLQKVKNYCSNPIINYNSTISSLFSDTQVLRFNIYIEYNYSIYYA